MMNKIVLASVMALTLVLTVGCQKKDGGEAPPPPPGMTCNSTQVYSSFFNSCLDQYSCPSGAAQSPREPSTCVDIVYGKKVSSLQCGAGYFLTENGCLTVGPCSKMEPGTAWNGSKCVPIIGQGMAASNPNINTGTQYYGNQFQQGGFPMQPMYNGGFAQPYMGYRW